MIANSSFLIYHVRCSCQKSTHFHHRQENLIKINTFFCLKPFTTNLALYFKDIKLASCFTLIILIFSKTLLPLILPSHKYGYHKKISFILHSCNYYCLFSLFKSFYKTLKFSTIIQVTYSSEEYLEDSFLNLLDLLVGTCGNSSA